LTDKFFDRPLLSAKSDKGGQDTVLIVSPYLVKGKDYHSSAEDQLSEAIGLTQAIDLKILDTRIVKIARISPSLLIGSGACEEIGHMIEALKPSVVFVNHNLSPGQQRNLEKTWKAKVIDRTGLILEIFADRAQTREGKIQVELAQLEYVRSRLVRLWTHLERQRGGAGFMGGPGERQIELDRRMIADKIIRLKKDLEQVRKNRELQRKSRERIPFPIVAIVGYTNAGKSTLFNRLTGADVFVEDLLFATLDPTLRRVKLKNGQTVILSDTVGFIADLPTHLVAAFRATLEQTQFADIILHVRDIARPDTDAQKENVNAILQDLGIDVETDERIIEVFNKIDALKDEDRDDVMRQASFGDRTIALSALTGEGLEDLLEIIEDHTSRNRQNITFHIPPSDGEALAWLYNKGKILDRQDAEDYISLQVDLEPAHIGQFRDRFSYEPVTS